MMKLFAHIVLGLLFLASCDSPRPKPQTPSADTKDKLTRYRAELALNDSTNLPFIFYRGETSITIQNGGEQITLRQNLRREDDSLEYLFPVYNSVLNMLCSKEECAGYFWDKDKGDTFRIKFVAEASDAPRFKQTDDACCSLKDQWEVIFRYDSDRPRHALGEFAENDSGYTGSIITPTGDYRFLQGVMNGRHLQMATFDGKFAYYFSAELIDKELKGHYYAGLSEAIPWRAQRNDTFALPDATGLTHLASGYDRVDFALPNQNGDTLRPEFGKVHLIQILGSWCPNCSDEAKVLESLYQKYGDDGLTVTGIAFEMRDDSAAGWKAIAKMKEDLGLSYPIVYAGKADPKNTSQVLPMLNRVMAYPTLIILNRRGEVHSIKTGFKGPGTSFFDQYIEDMERLINDLLYE
ncbi:MAG: TlpA family protein disulfide reductase [Cryomorphaceae bacterium]|nr:TlpA family protein disulfide reductase [Cryomorphaceae bacterium]